MKDNSKILIVDAEYGVHLGRFIQDEISNAEVTTYSSAREAEDAIRSGAMFDLILVRDEYSEESGVDEVSGGAGIELVRNIQSGQLGDSAKGTKVVLLSEARRHVEVRGGYNPESASALRLRNDLKSIDDIDCLVPHEPGEILRYAKAVCEGNDAAAQQGWSQRISSPPSRQDLGITL